MRFLLTGSFVIALGTAALAQPALERKGFPSNMTPIPSMQMAASCKNDGETCSGEGDRSCCSGLTCRKGGTGQGYICF